MPYKDIYNTSNRPVTALIAVLLSIVTSLRHAEPSDALGARRLGGETDSPGEPMRLASAATGRALTAISQAN